MATDLSMAATDTITVSKSESGRLAQTDPSLLGQSSSTVQMTDLLDGNAILLVSLAKGLLGEETSRLLGSFIVARLWQAAMHRADRPEPDRPDFNLYLDEFHNYLYLPQSLDEVLAEARGYRLSLTLANQHLAQLSATTREALAANARTRVVFQCGQEDAASLGKEFAQTADWLLADGVHRASDSRQPARVRGQNTGRGELSTGPSGRRSVQPQNHD